MPRTGRCRRMRPDLSHACYVYQNLPSLATNGQRPSILRRTCSRLFPIILLRDHCRSSKMPPQAATNPIPTLLETRHHRSNPAANLPKTQVPRTPPEEYPFGARCLCISAAGWCQRLHLYSGKCGRVAGDDRLLVVPVTTVVASCRADSPLLSLCM